jgi:hypothetical protein
MPCYKPIQAWRAKSLNENGKRPIVFNLRDAYLDMPITIPCGKCIGCRLEKSRQWAIRCMHEASLYQNNCFITLTFKDSCLPKNNSIDVGIFQRFMKRLRKRCKGLDEIYEPKKEKYIRPIRVFYCGEYGTACKNCGKSEQACACGKFQKGLGRPHFHACLFNFDFKDKYVWSNNNGNLYYRSDLLEDLWQGQGYCIIGDLTYESAGYTARYVTKKLDGKLADETDHYLSHYDGVTGEQIDKVKEFAHSSRNPGLATWWFDQYKTDVYPNDFILVKGKRVKPPKFYDKLFEKEHPMDYAILKSERKSMAEQSSDNTFNRLIIREEIQERKFKKLKRGYEND